MLSFLGSMTQKSKTESVYHETFVHLAKERYLCEVTFGYKRFSKGQRADCLDITERIGWKWSYWVALWGADAFGSEKMMRSAALKEYWAQYPLQGKMERTTEGFWFWHEEVGGYVRYLWFFIAVGSLWFLWREQVFGWRLSAMSDLSHGVGTRLGFIRLTKSDSLMIRPPNYVILV